MKVFNLKIPMLTAALYFGANMQAQQHPDSIGQEKKIDEVVVIGYGTQKRSNVTGAISSIKSQDIATVANNGRVEDVLEGKAAGVQVISNNGQPGSSSTIRIRGVSTFNNSDPYYIVDGTPVSPADINQLDQSDIESIEVLKDAASAAIYGVQSGTGVVLITTKKGRSGKLTLSYNGSYGISAVAKKIPLLNATEYATIMNEKSINSGGGILFANPAAFGVGTDWQSQIFKSAGKQNQEISISGGNEKFSLYTSLGYLDQQGIVLPDISRYTKLGVRINSTYKIAKWITVGENINYAHTKTVGIGNTNSEFGGPLSSALNLDPLTAVTLPKSAIGTGYYVPSNAYLTDPNGNPYGISSQVGQEMTNPIAYQMTRAGQYSYADSFLGNAYLDIKPIEHLTLHSQIGGDLSYSGWEGFTPLFYLSPTVNDTQNNLSRSTAKWFKWSFENTLTYERNFGKHHITGMIGTGYYVNNIGEGTSVTYYNQPVNNYQDASFNFSTPTTNIVASAWNNNGVNKSDGEYRNTSLFGRLLYDYDGKYLFTGVLRRDGSSKFGPDNAYGVFPSFSAGWVPSREEFWGQNNVISYLKFLGGWGKNGTERNLAPGMWDATITGGNNYTIGGLIVSGYSPTTVANPSLHWEQSVQTNLGLESRWAKNTVTFNLNFFKKDGKDILGQLAIPGYVGVPNEPYYNIYSLTNKGLEVELGYNKRFGDFAINITGTGSYIENKVTSTGDLPYIYGNSFQAMGAITRIQTGYAYNSFFGYQTAGIFQNQAQIDAYKNANGQLIQPNAKPGDFKWVDTNGDGQITTADIKYLGSPIPKYYFGFNMNFTYKNFDMVVFLQGAADFKIFQGYRRLDILNANYSTDILSRWVGPGTSNTVPRLSNDDPNHDFSYMSPYYLQDGSYCRIKTVQIGYTLPQDVLRSFGASKVRLYVAADNLYTITKYKGFDPEIGGDTPGIDRGNYPLARTFTFGANIQF